MAPVDIPKTFGALLLGGLFSAVLSGVVAVESILYFKLYPSDSLRVKVLVSLVWLLDVCHTGFVWAALWDYLIAYYGVSERITFIPWNIALSIVFTAVLTFLVHCFFAHRIFLLSKRNWWLTIPVLVLAVLRLGASLLSSALSLQRLTHVLARTASACATAGEMIHLHSFLLFNMQYRWLFTLGLALSSGIDVLITSSLFYLLHSSRVDASSNGLNVVIDLLVRHAFEIGTLTCVGTIASMICYLAMGNNLIFMGLHFVISKLYATSLLVTLNTRQTILQARSQATIDRELSTLPFDKRRSAKNRNFVGSPMSQASPRLSILNDFRSKSRKLQVEVNVERSVEYKSDMTPNSPSTSVILHDR